MVTGFTIGTFAISHGILNTLIFIGLLYQGWLGVKIRRQRKTGQLQFIIVKRHRKLGAVLISVAAVGYVSGLTLVLVDTRNPFEYPLHLFFGSTAIFLLLTQYTISTAIKGPESPWRTAHYYAGAGTLCVYVVQLLLGVAILF